MRRAFVATVAATVGVSTFIALTAHPGRAATVLVVNSTADSGGSCPGASCTLRAAIAVANTVGSSPTTITFGASTNGTPIALTSGQMEIMAAAGSVTINGNGPANTIIDASGQTDRIFQVDATATVSLTQMTLRNGTLPSPSGNGGGAILISGSGTLTVNDTVFTNNNGGFQLGGAIFNFGGTLNVLNSTFSGGNTSGDGGAIASLGATTIANTTITGNHASGEGGGFFSNSASSPVSIVNSTIASNTTSDGGGIAVETGTTQVTNSIIAKNTATTTGANCFLGDTGIVGDGGHNLEDGTAPGTCGFAASAVHADPALGTLANNGGPTSTLAITNTSPAYNTASASVCAAAPISGVDQRGDSRVNEATGDTACDIGAFEVQAAVTPTPSPTALPTPPTGSVAPAGGDMTGLAVGSIGVAMLGGLAIAVSRRRV